MNIDIRSQKGEILKFIVDITDEAKEDFRKLDKSSQKKITRAFEWIEKYDIDFVETKHLEEDLYEIITDNVRALYGYAEDQVIVVAVIFLKKTQKTPIKYKEKAKKIIKREVKQ